MIEVVVTGEDEAVRASLANAVSSAEGEFKITTLDTPGELGSYLEEQGNGIDTLILADLRTQPVLDTLEAIKTDPGTRRTPIVGFVDPGDEETVDKAYDRHVNACVPVPENAPDGGGFEETVEATISFFTRSVRLPESPRSGHKL